MTKSKVTNNPVEYQKAALPFKTEEEANAAMQAFLDAVYELRCRHCVANVSFVIEDSIEGSGTFFVNCHFGDATKEEGMAAWNLGQAQAARQQRVREMLESSLKHAVHTLEDRK